MGTITEKLDYLRGTKSEIKAAIEEKGVTVADEDTFRAYADKIRDISTGSVGSEYVIFDDCVYYPEVWDMSYNSKKYNNAAIISEIVPDNSRVSSSAALRGIYLTTKGLKSIMFTKPLPIKGYSKLRIAMTMIPYFDSINNWAHTYLMLCSSVNMSNVYTPADILKTIEIWKSEYGSNTSTKYYANKVFEFDLTDIESENVYLCITHCDGTGKLNSIMLWTDKYIWDSFKKKTWFTVLKENTW